MWQPVGWRMPVWRGVAAVTVACLLPVGVQACGPYRVGLKEYPHLYERTGKASSPAPDLSQHAGLDSEFFALLAARSGCRFTFELMSQPRVWARMKDGAVDITSWVIPTPERRTLVAIIPLLTVRPVAYTWAPTGVPTQQAFLARPEWRAVAVKNTSYGPGYDALLATLRAEGRVSEVADVDAAVRVFLARRVELLITYPWVLLKHMPAQGGPLEAADWQPDGRPILSGLALSRRTVPAADQQRLLAALKDMHKDGTLAALVARYLPGTGVGQVVPDRLE